MTWRTKKQTVVARSNAEAEFRVVTYAFCEGMWIKRILKELRIPTPEFMKVFYDNEAAIRIARLSFTMTKPSMLR